MCPSCATARGRTTRRASGRAWDRSSRRPGEAHDARTTARSRAILTEQFGGHRSSPVDRARTGSKYHLLTDSGGIPLAISLTGGQRNDVTQLSPLVDGVGPVRGKVGRPRQRAERLLADRGYDHDKYRRELWKRGVKPVIARRGEDHGSGLGRERWVVERTSAHLHNLRRLRTRYERDDALHLAFMLLGCAIVCQRRLTAA